MKKTICLLVVLCSLIVLPFPALGSTNANPEAISALVTQMNKANFSEGFWLNATYDYTQNAIIVEIATDGWLQAVVYLINNEMTSEDEENWELVKKQWSDVYNVYASTMKMYGCNDCHFVLRLVNDDAYIRNDYSTIAYNPLLVIEDGVVVADIVEDMKSN